jgi:hypothetical protein
MAELDTIVNVNITADSTSVSQAGFGTPLVLSYHTVFADRYKIYTSLAEMSEDGFATYDHAYRMAKAAFDQDPTVEQVVVGRLPAAPSFATRLTMTSAVQGVHIKFKVIQPATGTVTQIDYTIGASETTTTVATAVELLTEAVTGVDSTSSTSTVTLTPTVAGRRVFVYDLENCTVLETTADAGYDTELTALELEPDLDFYFITTDSSSTANVADVAAWTLSRKKLYFAALQNSGLLDNTDTVASDLLALANDRTVILYSKNAHEFADVAWTAVIGCQTPGSITAALKTLIGVTVSSLNTTQKTNLENDNVNHYMAVKNRKVTRKGKVVGGEWIDIRHGIDALEARIQETVFDLLADSSKVPFTEAGFQLISAAIEAACQAFVGTDNEPGMLVAGSIKVIMPKLSTISDTDKNNRELKGVRFSALLSGAIHYVEIRGTLTNA